MKKPIMLFGSIITIAVIAFLVFTGVELHKMRVAQQEQVKAQKNQAESQKAQVVIQAIKNMQDSRRP